MTEVIEILSELISEAGKSLRQIEVDSGVRAIQFSVYLRGSVRL